MRSELSLHPSFSAFALQSLRLCGELVFLTVPDLSDSIERQSPAQSPLQLTAFNLPVILRNAVTLINRKKRGSRVIFLRKMKSSNNEKAARGKTTQAHRVRQASRVRREREKEGLRRIILDAAGQLFLEQGYEGFSMRRVAERIGYSATTIYRYYEDKDDLLFAVVNEGFSEFARQLKEAAEGVNNPLKRLEALWHAYVRFGLSNPVYYQLMFMQRADLLFESRREQSRPMIESFDELQKAVGAAMDAGVMKRGEVLTFSRVIWSLVHGVTALALADPKRFTPEVVEKNSRLALKMISVGLG